MYRIRHVDGDDYHEELLEMQQVCLPECKPVSVEDGGEWWLAFFEDEPIGFGAIRPSVSWRYTGYLSRAGVLPKHRGHMLQRRLIQARERWALRQGWQWLLSDTITNPHSANNLSRAGFHMFDAKNPWARPEALYWRKYIGGDRKSEMPR